MQYLKFLVLFGISDNDQGPGDSPSFWQCFNTQTPAMKLTYCVYTSFRLDLLHLHLCNSDALSQWSVQKQGLLFLLIVVLDRVSGLTHQIVTLSISARLIGAAVSFPCSTQWHCKMAVVVDVRTRQRMVTEFSTEESSSPTEIYRCVRSMYGWVPQMLAWVTGLLL